MRQACSTPGCYRLTPEHSTLGLCSHCRKAHHRSKVNDWHKQRLWHRRHQNLRHWIENPPLTQKEKWAKLKDRTKQNKKHPLTRAQRKLYEHELNRLLRDNPPKSHIHYIQLCNLASAYARAGGREAFLANARSKRCSNRYKRWKYGRWLRDGDYDPKLLWSPDLPGQKFSVRPPPLKLATLPWGWWFWQPTPRTCSPHILDRMKGPQYAQGTWPW